MHLLAPMLDFGEQQRVLHFPFFTLLEACQSHAARLGPGIDFERDRLHRGVAPLAVAQSNDKGLHAMHHGPSCCEQQARPFGRAGHQRLFVSVEHEHHRNILSFPLRQERPLTGRFDAPRTGVSGRLFSPKLERLVGSSAPTRPLRVF